MAIYRLSAAAKEDIAELLAYTDASFGEVAMLRYERLLITALLDITADPERRGSLARPELGENIRSYHMRYSRERAGTDEGIVRYPRHLLLYRFTRADLIGIGRVLHDAMELERHLPSNLATNDRETRWDSEWHNRRRSGEVIEREKVDFGNLSGLLAGQ